MPVLFVTGRLNDITNRVRWYFFSFFFLSLILLLFLDVSSSLFLPTDRPLDGRTSVESANSTHTRAHREIKEHVRTTNPPSHSHPQLFRWIGNFPFLYFQHGQLMPSPLLTDLCLSFTSATGTGKERKRKTTQSD